MDSNNDSEQMSEDERDKHARIALGVAPDE